VVWSKYVKDAGERFDCDECLARFVGLCSGICELGKGREVLTYESKKMVHH
jgi:hypothetical protein